MTYLDEIGYSQEDCIASIRSYYHFLTQLYLPSSTVVSPPPSGWPSITSSTLAPLNKTPTVLSLLQHLPYIEQPRDGDLTTVGAPRCFFADWATICSDGSLATPEGVEDVKVMSENLQILGIDYEEQLKLIPPHVIGLTYGARDNSTILLDTESGVIYWVGCPGRIESARDRPAWYYEGDAFEYEGEEGGLEWRSSPAWPVAEFFEMLKREFVEMRFIPTGVTEVGDVVELELSKGQYGEEVVGVLRGIYRRYGWPDLERYRKGECLEEVGRVLEERWRDQRARMLAGEQVSDR